MSAPSSKAPLTPRQAKLINRLQVICGRAATNPLPVNIEEIWGFGSLFRAKERPGDLDLLVKYSGHNPAYKTFAELMKEARKYHAEFRDPRLALSHVVQMSGDVHAKEFLNIFSDWLEGYTWNKIFSGSIPEISYNWGYLSIRILKRSLPRVTILLEGLGEDSGLKAGSRVLLWSRTNPDLYHHLDQIFGSSQVREGIMKEIENFEEQIHSGNLEAEVIKKLFQEIRIETSWGARRDLEKWMEERAIRLFPELPKESVLKMLNNIHRMFPVDPQIPFNFIDIYSNCSLNCLKEIVEQKRVQVDEARWRLEVYRGVISNLIQWKVGKLYEEGRFAKLPMDAWIAMETLREIPKGAVSEEKIRHNLRQLDLPEHKVLAQKGHGKILYLIPKTYAEESEIRNYNIQVEAERNYVRQLQPEIKRIDKEFSLKIEFDSKQMPKLARIFYNHRIMGNEDMSAIEPLLRWCRDHGFDIKRNNYRIFAELIISIEQCKDVKEVKSKIRKLLA